MLISCWQKETTIGDRTSTVPVHKTSDQMYDEVVAPCTRAYGEDFAVLMPTGSTCWGETPAGW